MAINLETIFVHPLISVIMSSYNNQLDIRKAIESVLNQSYPHWELVISDDASADQTRSLIDSYQDPRIKKFHSTVNRGIVAQMNMLFSKATGEYITILDADDMIAANKLELQLKAFSSNPQLALCWSWVAICDEQDNILSTRKDYPLTDQLIRQYIQQKSAMPCGNIACMMFKKNSLVKHGGYKDFYTGIGSWDVDLALRILQDGEAVMLPQVLHFWRKHPHSFSRKINFNPLRNQSHQFAHLLYQQRQLFGKDDLTGLNTDALTNLKNQILSEYQTDKSKIFRDICRSKDLPRNVRLDYGLRAIKTNPTSVENYRYVLKCLLGN